MAKTADTTPAPSGVTPRRALFTATAAVAALATLGAAPEASAETVILAPLPPATAADRLWRCLALVQMAEQQFGQLPDGDPHEDVLLDRIDALLGEAALIRPDTAEAFGVKARIAKEHGDNSAAGGMVLHWLLLDLMSAGGMTGEA
jgi:hypothetical protein